MTWVKKVKLFPYLRIVVGKETGRPSINTIHRQEYMCKIVLYAILIYRIQFLIFRSSIIQPPQKLNMITSQCVYIFEAKKSGLNFSHYLLYRLFHIALCQLKLIHFLLFHGAFEFTKSHIPTNALIHSKILLKNVTIKHLKTHIQWQSTFYYSTMMHTIIKSQEY
jgi:hypothetical protein